ncbi:MAG: hypothetical protein J6D21_02410 [Clostridia bacterium]|nr:hypothetical protein [Clostridia bacterium]
MKKTTITNRITVITLVFMILTVLVIALTLPAAATEPEPEASYTVTIEQSPGGTVISDNDHPGNASIRFMVIPDEGYQFVRADAFKAGNYFATFLFEMLTDNAFVLGGPEGDTVIKNILFKPLIVAWNDINNDGVIDEGEPTYEYIGDALMAGGEVKLANDYDASGEEFFELRGTEEAPISATLDLNGYTLKSNRIYLLDIYEHFSLTVKDTSDTKKGTLLTTEEVLIFCNNPTSQVTLIGGNICATKTVICMPYGSVEITGGMIDGMIEGNPEHANITGGSFRYDPSDFLRDDYCAIYDPETNLYDVAFPPYSVSIEYGEIDPSLVSISPDKNKHFGAGDTVSFQFTFDDTCIFESAEIWANGKTIVMIRENALDENGTYFFYVPDADVVVKNIVAKKIPESRITGISINADSPAYNSYSKEFVITDETPLIITVTGDDLDLLDLEGNDSQHQKIMLVTNKGDCDVLDIGTYEMVGDTIVITVTAEELEAYVNGNPDVRITHVAYTDVENIGYEDYIPLRLELKKNTVSVVATEHGEMLVYNSNADAGEEVHIVYGADVGYYFDRDTLSVTDENGQPVEVVKHTDGVSFIMPEGNVTVSCSTKEYISLEVTVSKGETELPLDGTGTINIGDTVTVNIIASTESINVEMGIKGSKLSVIFSLNELSYTLTAEDYYDSVHDLLCDLDHGVYNRTFFIKITDAAGFEKVYFFELPDYDSLLPLPEHDYKITLGNSENGSLNIGVTSADEGDLICVACIGALGYVFDSITVTDDDGNPVEVNISSKHCYFYMPASDVTVSAEFVVTTDPQIGGIFISNEKHTYDPVTDTVTVSPSNPLVVTIEGIRLNEFGENLPWLAISSDNAQWTGINPISINEEGTKATYIFSYEEFYASGKLWLAYSVDGRYVQIDHFVELNVILSDEDPTVHSITAGVAENGTVELSRESGIAGVSVIIDAVPSEGYVIDTVTVTTSGGDPVQVVDGRFVMPEADVTVSVTFKEKPATVDPGPDDSDPADNNPVDNDPVDGDPVDGDPADNNPVDGDPVDGDPVDGDPVDGDPVDGDPVDGDPVDGDPVDGDPVDSDPVESDPVDSDPVDSDPVDSDPVDSDPVDSDPVDSDPVDSDPADSNPADGDPIDRDTFEDVSIDNDSEKTESDTASNGGGKVIVTVSIVTVLVVLIVGIVFIFKKKHT